jgi:hypothetical protein
VHNRALVAVGRNRQWPASRVGTGVLAWHVERNTMVPVTAAL